MNRSTARILEQLGFRPNGPTSEDQIASLEATLGVRFPADYRAFLIATGGGDFDEGVICRCISAPPSADADLAPLESFLGEGVKDDDLETVYQRSRSVGMSPALIPISVTLFGDYYCLEYSYSAPRVAYWDHESGDHHLVAHSFDEFVSRMIAAPEDDDDDDDDDEGEIWIHPDLQLPDPS